MEEHNEIAAMLQLMPQPAFRVKEGVISHVNQAAQAMFVQVGQGVAPMLLTGAEEYAEFTQGSLYLTLSIGQQPFGACVTRLENADIFTLEQTEQAPALQAMALAAAQLREPMTGLMSLSEQMLPVLSQDREDLQTQAAQMNRRLYQMLRIITNMSDAAAYAQLPEPPTEYVEICGFVEEILEKTAALAHSANCKLEYDLPREPIFTLADNQRLERAIYNMLSNAMKFASAGSVVHASLQHKNNRLYFSVVNDHPGPQGNLYSRFLREPALEDPRNGIGLGMVLLRAVAAQHGGAVLVDHMRDGTRITFAMPIRQSSSSHLSSPVMRIDYAGERDHALMELADVLPAQAYHTQQIN